MTTLALATAAWAADSAAPRMQVVYDAVLRNGFTIRHDHQEKLQGITRLYLSTDPNSGFVDVPTEEIVSVDRMEVPQPPPAPAAQAATREDVERWVNSASDQHQVDPDLVRSVIKAESGFNTRAVSPKGAQGLMQLMPGTASQLGVKDAFAPGENVEGGTRYLRDLLVLYNNDMAKALAAYNAGPQRVAQYNGVPPYRETHAYVARVIKDFNRTKLAARAAARQNSKAAAGTTPKKQRAAETKPRTKSQKPTVPVAN
ncbi:MAG TPA: lytic transglycosylase domain-containing protein [Terriglobales bacterium]|nr:lytic transglycosylase domain-containing protein [Terriglobales bacterium]